MPTATPLKSDSMIRVSNCYGVDGLWRLTMSQRRGFVTADLGGYTGNYDYTQANVATYPTEDDARQARWEILSRLSAASLWW